MSKYFYTPWPDQVHWSDNIWQNRRSHRRCSIKKDVIRNFAKFTGKHLKRPATLLKKRLWHRCFPVNFAKFPRAPFLQNPSGRLLLAKIESFLNSELRSGVSKLAFHLNARLPLKQPNATRNKHSVKKYFSIFVNAFY